jgi:O-antigen/teichoic acid export membrane protein
MNENKLIAKNSLILYLRLLISTVIGLYVSRVVLLQLGADNFGLFAVVGGLVSLMAFLNSSMIATSNRFIAVELGKKENSNPNKIFNTLLVIHIILAIVILIIAETLGVWYIKNYLNVNTEKIPDALFVLHFSVLSVAIGTISIPFQGLVTADEKFIARATIEIVQTFVQLGLVILLTLYAGNKLRAYSIIVFFITFLTSILYFFYCRLKYNDIVKWELSRQRSDYRDISNFFGWMILYVLGTVGAKQGGALIINLFFGTALNAAFGMASKVSEYIFSFVKNLNQAAVPQIMKNYSGGNQERSLTLIYKLSKFTFFIMLIPAVPIILSIDSILVLWLKEVPEYTKQFVVLMLINGLISCTESGFDATIEATGKIRKSKIFFSIITLSTLPILYLLFMLKFPPYTMIIVLICAEIIYLLVQIRILTTLTDFKINEYLSSTILPVLLVTIIIVPQIFLRTLFGVSFIDVIIFSIISVTLTIINIYFAGLNKQERKIINNYLSKLNLIIRT